MRKLLYSVIHFGMSRSSQVFVLKLEFISVVGCWGGGIRGVLPIAFAPDSLIAKKNVKEKRRPQGTPVYANFFICWFHSNRRATRTAL